MGGATWFRVAEITWCLRRTSLDLCAHTSSYYIVHTPRLQDWSLHFSQHVWSSNFRAIESVYKEHCEKNSKEQPTYLDRNGADDLEWTESAVWEKVRTLVVNPHFIVKEGQHTELCFFPSQDGGAGFPGNSD